MQAASTEFVADGVDPRVALDVALPPTMPSLPPDPSRAPYPLPQSIGADASLRSLGFLVVFLERSTRLDSPLRSILRSGEGVFHPSMPCARVTCGRREVTGSM